MILATDVQYDNDAGTALVAGVGFHNWGDPEAAFTWTSHIPEIEDYEPGSFYKRELPCLLELLRIMDTEPDVIIVDGNVWNGPGRPGLGFHLSQALEGRIPIIGVAKSKFRGSEPVSVYRGRSNKPLFVTAEGLHIEDAADHIREMAGANRHPTLLKLVDQLARGR